MTDWRSRRRADRLRRSGLVGEFGNGASSEPDEGVRRGSGDPRAFGPLRSIADCYRLRIGGIGWRGVEGGACGLVERCNRAGACGAIRFF